jgi:putative redox protein
MVAIRFEYQGDLHCRAVHGPSGTEHNTNAPKDNQGRGESFSPTDLVASALGTCMLTVMGIAARTLNIDIPGTTATAGMKEPHIGYYLQCESPNQCQGNS